MTALNEPAASIQSLWIAPTAGAPVISVEGAEVLAGRGLAGDRYARGAGTFSQWPGAGREVTLIDAGDVDDIAAGFPGVLSPGWHRRNVVTRGIDLRSLLRRKFRIGSVLLRGERPAEPCAHLERCTGVELLALMARRGGLRATVLEGGEIHCGDVLLPEGPPVPLP